MFKNKLRATMQKLQKVNNNGFREKYRTHYQATVHTSTKVVGYSRVQVEVQVFMRKKN